MLGPGPARLVVPVPKPLTPSSRQWQVPPSSSVCVLLDALSGPLDEQMLDSGPSFVCACRSCRGPPESTRLEIHDEIDRLCLAHVKLQGLCFRDVERECRERSDAADVLGLFLERAQRTLEDVIAVQGEEDWDVRKTQPGLVRHREV